MSTTIIEVLQNAQYNFDGEMPQIQMPLAKRQLANAITALENGYSPFDDYNEAMLTTEPTPPAADREAGKDE